MDREQLAVYAEKYSKAVYRAAYSYVHNHADSEDITEEAFLRLYKCKKAFSSDENVKAWLLRVAINIAKDHLKSSWIHKREELDESMKCGDENEYSLDEAMAKLKPDYRIAVYLHYYMGYSVRETAKLLGITESNVKIRLKRGRDALREILTDEQKGG
ncbi:MAG: RNA polymerase sigma factor [Ruminiclostridium sp.]|nr:RNA polymerase sigma factor [Ruminiclostridium sp.]